MFKFFTAFIFGISLSAFAETTYDYCGTPTTDLQVCLATVGSDSQKALVLLKTGTKPDIVLVNKDNTSVVETFVGTDVKGMQYRLTVLNRLTAPVKVFGSLEIENQIGYKVFEFIK